MEKVQTTPEIAAGILAAGNRKITLSNDRVVKWINLNNDTCFAEKNQSGSTYNTEDVEFFINVPSNAKTVY